MTEHRAHELRGVNMDIGNMYHLSSSFICHGKPSRFGTFRNHVIAKHNHFFYCASHHSYECGLLRPLKPLRISDFIEFTPSSACKSSKVPIISVRINLGWVNWRWKILDKIHLFTFISGSTGRPLVSGRLDGTRGWGRAAGWGRCEIT
jgi:hypothetical protein